MKLVLYNNELKENTENISKIVRASTVTHERTNS